MKKKIFFAVRYILVYIIIFAILILTGFLERDQIKICVIIFISNTIINIILSVIHKNKIRR